MARRRVSEPVAAPGAVPAVLMEYAKSAGFWDTRNEVEMWCEREGLDRPPEQYFMHPPGLRQWCIDAWARREGFVDRWGNVSFPKLMQVGIWRGYGSSGSKARHPQAFRREDLEAWRPISAPPTND
jgi:hypothetical protein